MKVFLLMSCDDEYVYGIYSTYDLMVKKIEKTSCRPKTDFCYFEVTVDECDLADFDYNLGKEIK